MHSPYCLWIFSLLFLTVHCSLELASSSAHCLKSSKILQARQGEIHSSTRSGPSSPVNCSWIITSAVGERVIISFSEVFIRCGWSWLSLTTATGHPQSVCGNELPKPMEFYEGNITVTHHFVPHFFSVSEFRLSYIKDTGPCYPGEFECYSERCLPMSWRCNGQVECLGDGDELGSDEEDCDAVEALPHQENEPTLVPPENPSSSVVTSNVEMGRRASDLSAPAQGGPCGGFLQAFYGSFVPPVLTGSAMECVWSVDPQDSRPLKLELQQLALGSSDVLIITDQPGGGGNIILTVTSASNYKTVEVESPTGLLSLTYRVQEASDGRGFNATYRIADYCLPWEGLCKGSDGGCYTSKQRCDGHWDCAETGLDEDGCGGCPAGYFPCGTLALQRTPHSRPACYSIKERCNYQLNCADGSDERECKVCQPGTFHCDSDRCVFESWRCDGQVDCKDGTDELNCTVTLPRKVITAATVGSLVCGLLLVIAMGCTCKLYSLRTREHSLFAPITRQEAEFIQQQAPPSYGQLIAQGIIPPVEDFPTENPNEPTSLSLRGLLQILRQDNISSPRRRRRPRIVRRAIRRLRRFQMMAFTNPLLLLLFLLVLMPHILGKCIFDEVQSSIRVLSPPSTFKWAFKEDDAKHEVSLNKQEDWLTHVQIQDHQNAISQDFPHERSKRMIRDGIEVISTLQPISIKMWTTRESAVLPQSERERLDAAVSDAISTVSKLLAVWRVSSTLLLQRDINKYCRFIWRNSSAANFNKCGRASDNYQTESCLGVTIPDDHLRGCAVYPHPDQPDLTVIKEDGTGLPDTDVVLYVTAQSTDKCRADSSVLAYSAHCQSDSEGRPLAGVMVICREPLSSEGFSHEHMVQTVIHEMLHVLGFSKELFSKWTDRSLSSQRGMDSSHGQMIYSDEFGQMRLYSPNVNKALHRHLNTSHTDLGAPLENQDADSRGFSSHWEARVMQGSIMTAMLPEPALVQIDAITFSALQDTGWYAVNHSHGQNLLWGENEGALFGSVSTCIRPSSFFCTGSGFGCHYLHLHKGVCQSDQYLEGCRIYKPLANGSECWKEENETGRGSEMWSGEIFSSDSRCFLSNIIKEDRSSLNTSLSGRCYRHRCTGRNKYQIKVRGSDWLNCPPGRSIKVFGYRGAVFCPDKRLCHYKDITPPTSLHKPLPTILPFTTSLSRDRFLTEKPTTGLRFDFAPSFSETGVMTTMGVIAVLFFLGSLMIIHRKCYPSRHRVHVLLPYTLHV